LVFTRHRDRRGPVNVKEKKVPGKKLNGIAKRKINRKAAAGKRSLYDRLEPAENAFLRDTCGGISFCRARAPALCA
jgi:hypothetical protein